MSRKTKPVKSKSAKFKMEYISTDNHRDRISNYLLAVIHTCVVFICMGLSALWMLGDVFEELRISAAHTFLIMAAMLPLILAIEAAKAGSSRILALWKYGVPLLYADILLVYGVRSSKAIAAGISALAEPILDAVNFYYKTSFTVEVSEAANTEETLMYLAVIAFLIFLVLARWCRKRILLVILPAGILLLELMVGYAPDVASVIALFAGVLISGMGAWENRHAAKADKGKTTAGFLGYLVPILTLVLIPLFCTVCLRGTADYLAENGSLVLEYQEQLEEQLSSLVSSIGRNNWSTITNRSPGYSNEEVMAAALSEKPTESLYLRGYYGTNYVNGNWSDTANAFDAQWDSEEYNGSEITDLAGYQDMPDGTGMVTCQLSYTNLSTNIVFTPYTLSSAALENNCSVSGDYLVKKSRMSSEVTYEFWDIELEELKNLNTSIRATRTSQTTYAEYVSEHYMNVPDTVSSVKEIADELTLEVGTDNIQTLTKSGTTANARNQVKLEIAEAIQSYLRSWTYSMELDATSGGTDVVEYFLSETHTGYCVHYATAAALIFREMGVPARYVSGYRVDLDAFSEADGQWTASILDSDAHAWVEIYLEGIGWVPVEVTPGYGVESEQDSEEERSEAESEQAEPEAEPQSEESEETEQDTETEADTSSAAEDAGSEIGNEIAQLQEQLEAAQSGQNISGDGTESIEDLEARLAELEAQQEELEQTARIAKRNRILRIVGVAVAVLALIAAVVFIIYRTVILRRRQWMHQLKREMNSRRNRRAVQRINTRFYRLLRRKAGVRVRHMTDPEYGELLAKYFSKTIEKNWPRYIEIVQKAAFSQEEISEEEARFCYWMYRNRDNHK